jgi:SNF2 family DNA or RNA helicase
MTDEQKDESFRAYVDGFRSVDPKRFEPPASVAAQLRPYQRAGFQWLSALAAMGFGGILADEMGLGKSVQMISFLLANRGRGTSLVVCPSSLVYNWAAEFQKFAPQMDVAPVVGTAPERARIRRERGHEVLVTSYDLLRRDIEAYAPMDFWCEVLDEAQYIKNHETLSARAVKAVTARHRFALTGTPIENRLSELWSIFDYLMPGLLGGYDRFRERYEDPILAGDADCANRLRAAIGPFVLRRLKRDVLSDLPDKLEQVVYAQLSGDQRKLYSAHEQALRLSLASQSDQEFTRGKLQVLAELMRLRQLCCDPRLVYDGYDGPSAKLDTIFSLVERVVDAQAKVLVFSQFTSYLDLIAQRLDASGIAHFVLTGSTPKRRRIQLVDAFNQDDTPVFLISLKAGGTGLNLTGASVVVHADPWWNAAAQNQATDRAHRIGQTREVTVYKVIARDTVEDRILALQEAKSELANQVVGEGGGASLSSLRKEDLVDLLGQ